MTSVVLKSILGGSTHLWSRAGPSMARSQASGFASSSRMGLDFTLPLRAGSPTTGTTLVEAAPVAAPTPASTSTPFTTPLANPTPSTTTPRTTPSATSPKPTSPPTATPTTPTFKVTPQNNSKNKLPRFNREPIERSTNNSQTAPTHTLTVTSTRNNTLLTFSDGTGPIFPTISAGSDKTFKKSTRSSYEAAHQATLKMMNKILDYQSKFPYVSVGYGSEANPGRGKKLMLRVSFKGLFGQGRGAVSTAIGGPDGIDLRRCIVAVDDRTPIKIGGTRARKARRV